MSAASKTAVVLKLVVTAIGYRVMHSAHVWPWLHFLKI